MEYVNKELFLRTRSPRTERQLGNLGRYRLTPVCDWKRRVRLLKMVMRSVQVPRGERSERRNRS